MNDMSDSIECAERAIGYVFKDKSLLRRALTLSSADRKNSNEALEFFGDAVLEFIVSERIYAEGGDEGQMTERRKWLVSDTALAPVSEKLGLDKCLIHGKNDGNNKKAVPSVFEAVAAAVYLDGGLEEAKKFVYSSLDFSRLNPIRNYKGELQELLQSHGCPPPEYSRKELGNPQRPDFIAEVTVFGEKFTGRGESARQAEQDAARCALQKFGK